MMRRTESMRKKPGPPTTPPPPPKTSLPKASSPKAPSPRTSSPKTSSPKTSSPRTSSPRTSSPGTSSPGTSSPGTSSPGTSSPRTSSPRTSSERPPPPRASSPRTPHPVAPEVTASGHQSVDFEEALKLYTCPVCFARYHPTRPIRPSENGLKRLSGYWRSSFEKQTIIVTGKTCIFYDNDNYDNHISLSTKDDVVRLNGWTILHYENDHLLWEGYADFKKKRVVWEKIYLDLNLTGVWRWDSGDAHMIVRDNVVLVIKNGHITRKELFCEVSGLTKFGEYILTAESTRHSLVWDNVRKLWHSTVKWVKIERQLMDFERAKTIFHSLTKIPFLDPKYLPVGKTVDFRQENGKWTCGKVIRISNKQVQIRTTTTVDIPVAEQFRFSECCLLSQSGGKNPFSQFDTLYVNPRSDEGPWRKGTIVQIDELQIEVLYEHEGTYYTYWFHACDGEEVNVPHDEKSDNDIELNPELFPWGDPIAMGTRLDVMDGLNNWYPGEILQIIGKNLLMQYDGWSSKWNEWIQRGSRLAQYGTQKYHVNESLEEKGYFQHFAERDIDDEHYLQMAVLLIESDQEEAQHLKEFDQTTEEGKSKLIAEMKSLLPKLRFPSLRSVGEKWTILDPFLALKARCPSVGPVQFQFRALGSGWKIDIDNIRASFAGIAAYVSEECKFDDQQQYCLDEFFKHINLESRNHSNLDTWHVKDYVVIYGVTVLFEVRSQLMSPGLALSIPYAPVRLVLSPFYGIISGVTAAFSDVKFAESMKGTYIKERLLAAMNSKAEVMDICQDYLHTMPFQKEDSSEVLHRHSVLHSGPRRKLSSGL